MNPDTLIVTCIGRAGMRRGRFPALRTGGLILIAPLLAACTLWPSQPRPTVPPATALITDCATLATRTPPPEAPTFVPGPDGQLHDAVDPHVEICATRTTLAAGDSLTIVGLAVDIGLPIYRLTASPQEAGESITLAAIQYDNAPRPQETGTSPQLEITGMSADMQRVQFELKATAPGAIDLTITASGEVHYGYPGPATWSGGQSEPVSITITP